MKQHPCPPHARLTGVHKIPAFPKPSLTLTTSKADGTSFGQEIGMSCLSSMVSTTVDDKIDTALTGGSYGLVQNVSGSLVYVNNSPVIRLTISYTDGGQGTNDIDISGLVSAISTSEINNIVN